MPFGRGGARPASASTRVVTDRLSTETDWNRSRTSKRDRVRGICSKLFTSPEKQGQSNNLETKLALLEQENSILRAQITELEQENERLEDTRHAISPEQIVIERFEGERLPLYDADGEQVLPWYREDDEDDDEEEEEKVKEKIGGSEDGLKIVVGDKSAVVTPTKRSSSSSSAAEDPCDEYDDLTCPVEPDVSFADALRDRAYWLCGLLAMQSLSGFILARNEALLQSHPVIIYFLTMLVGAGGNAGNQASVRVIRGLALGTLNDRTQRQFLNRELKMAMSLCAILSAAGFIRAAAFRTPLPETIAITTSLALIVMSSICLGAVLPLLLQKLRVDPAHSSTTIQVVMDILGVVLTVVVSTAMLDSPIGQFIISKLTGL